MDLSHPMLVHNCGYSFILITSLMSISFKNASEKKSIEIYVLTINLDTRL